MTPFNPRHGEAVALGDQVTRITAPNAGPFTGAGTNTYLLGEAEVMIVDPGPDDPDHIGLIVDALGGRVVSHILITHTHRDHVDGLARLRAAVDAPTVAEGVHRSARPLRQGEANPFIKSGDYEFRPDIIVADGDLIENRGLAVRAIATPGHAANHMAFGLGDTLLTGDHVMGWSTTVIAPPEGAMVPYLDSLEKLLGVSHRRYLPGHGDVMLEPRKAVSAIKSHRLMRERAILHQVETGVSTVPAMVDALYAGIDPRLKAAAGLSVLAHLEKLEWEARVKGEGHGAASVWTRAVPQAV